MTQTIELASEPAFSLGRIRAFPAQRELVRDDGLREVLEHRVMQVLIALAHSHGSIVTRDDLMERCWHGRIVGDDALTRVMSRLRRASEGIGAGSFSIETITKIGYRLAEHGASENAERLANSQASSLSRRMMLVGGAATGTAAVASLGAVLRNPDPPASSDETQALMTQAWAARAQGTDEGNSQAIGLYRLLLDGAPRSADGWGLLAGAYGDRAHYFARSYERAALRKRARAAGLRSIELDHRNAYGRAAMACAQPMLGNWLPMEQTFRQAIADQPNKWLASYGLGLLLTVVGRFSAAAALFEQARQAVPTVMPCAFQVKALWGAGRLDEAERLLDEATSTFTTNGQLWNTRFDMFLYGGEPAKAVALAKSADDRPRDLSEDQLAQLVQLAMAVAGGGPRDVAAVVDRERRQATQSAPQAARAIQIFSAVGKIDEAFAYADAYFFSRGVVVPDDPPQIGAQSEAFLEERQTFFLFEPSTRAMRSDARFERLATSLGLERYWAEAGSPPDYKRLKSLGV